MILLKKKPWEISNRMPTFKEFIFFLFLAIVWGRSSYLLFSNIKFYDDNQKEFEQNFNGDAIDDTYNNKYLSHKLIDIDFKRGVTDLNTKKKALANVNKFYNEVNTQCHYLNTDKSTLDFLACSNRLLKKNFYYKPSEEVSNNYAKHQSDCDTNAYLMFDVTRQKGIDTYIVYTPDHAFISWRDSTGKFNDWETVSNNNEGQVADRNNDFLYLKTKDNSYYNPLKSESDIQDIYHVIITGLSNNDDYIKKIYQRNKDNSFIANNYFLYLLSKNLIDKKTIDFIESELNTPKSSITKKIILAYYYLNNNDMKKAKYFFKETEMSGCNAICYNIGVELNEIKYILFKPIFNIYKKYLDKKDISFLLSDFWHGLFLFFTGLIFVIIIIIINKFKIPSKWRYSINRVKINHLGKIS